MDQGGVIDISPPWMQGRSQKWPKEGVLRPEIVKEGGFEGAEAMRKRV